MKPVPSPFGTGIDEQATQDNMVEIVGGRSKADRLMYLLNNSYPSGTAYDRLHGRGKTKNEVFRSKAKAEGFSDEHIDAFLTVANS